MTYGAGSWTPTNKIESLNDAAKEILREIEATTYENGYWRTKIQQEISNKCKAPDIVTVIKVYKLKWLEHKNGWRKYSKEVTGRQARTMEKKGKIEQYGCKKIENKSFGQNRTHICNYGSQGQT